MKPQSIPVHMNAKKEDIVAQVGTEKIFRSDVDLLLKSYRIFSDDPKVSRHINNYYKSIAQVLTGLKLYPGISPLVQQDMELMKNRLLTSVYQRVYAFENLFFSDKELLEFYQKDTARFAIKGKQYTFSEIRPRIAEELYLERNKKLIIEILFLIFWDNAVSVCFLQQMVTAKSFILSIKDFRKLREYFFHQNTILPPIRANFFCLRTVNVTYANRA